MEFESIFEWVTNWFQDDLSLIINWSDGNQHDQNCESQIVSDAAVLQDRLPIFFLFFFQSGSDIIERVVNI